MGLGQAQEPSLLTSPQCCCHPTPVIPTESSWSIVYLLYLTTRPPFHLTAIHLVTFPPTQPPTVCLSTHLCLHLPAVPLPLSVPSLPIPQTQQAHLASGPLHVPGRKALCTAIHSAPFLPSSALIICPLFVAGHTSQVCSHCWLAVSPPRQAIGFGRVCAYFAHGYVPKPCTVPGT